MYSRNPKRYGARIGRYRVLKVLKKTGIHLTPQAQAEIDGAETSEELNLAILGLDLTPPDIKKGSLDAIKFQIMAKLTLLKKAYSCEIKKLRQASSKEEIFAITEEILRYENEESDPQLLLDRKRGDLVLIEEVDTP